MTATSFRSTMRIHGAQEPRCAIFWRGEDPFSPAPALTPLCEYLETSEVADSGLMRSRKPVILPMDCKEGSLDGSIWEISD